MRRRIVILLVTLGLVVGCGGGATASPTPSQEPTPVPTDIFVESPEPTVATTEAPTASAVAGKRYKVKSGDTMWAIAQKFGVSLAALKAANPTVDPLTMRVGTILIIPGK
jgi:LysM repeat protein